MSPSQEYKERLLAWRERAQYFERIHIRLGNVRLILAIIAAAMVWAALSRHFFSAYWLIVPAAAFIAIAVWHGKVLQARQHAHSAAAVYERGLARIEDRWAGTGQTGERFVDPHHVYAADLDMFGRGSLFELLSTARTRMGEEMLANWLLAPASLTTIRERQAAIDELRDRLDFREDLAVIEDTIKVGVNCDALIAWAEAPAILEGRLMRIVGAVLACLAVAGAVLWGVYGLYAPFLAVVTIEYAIAFTLRKKIDAATYGAEKAFDDLALLAQVLRRMEQEQFVSPALTRMQQQLLSHDTPASRAVAHLETLVGRIEQGHNLILQALNIPLLYMMQVAFAVEGWRRAHGDAVRRWLQAGGEIEALLSLATYRYEHPADPFPEFVEGSACFVAVELGHPLIAEAQCVRNSVELCGRTRVLLVSGSNMSGKSTLLRAVGINTVLAMVGAPVRARGLRLSPLHVGASIRVSDSLQEGSSRFYAEISRLRQLVDLAGRDVPLLFLIDEFLQGTNSRDRRLGAEGLIRELIQGGAIGLVTTHDLALTEVVGADGQLRNVHFQDYLEAGHMRFDYKLRDGVVARSNGLELMRSIGLRV